MTPRRKVHLQRRVLELSNLDKVLYPAAGFTKGQVLDYYRRVATWLLPHLRGRPLTLKRYPDGVEEEFFYEKQCPRHKPDWVVTSPLRHSEGKEVNYCTIADLPSLMWVVNLASLELHLLLCRAVAPDRPTVVAFDLDPGPPAELLVCARMALRLHDVLEGIGLKSFAKVSGGKGMHFYVPVNTPVTFEQTKGFALTVAQELEKHHGDEVTSKMSKALRKGKVFIDWSQNDSHKTTICVYSLRATPRPQVAAPVTWDEVRAAVRAGKPSRLVFSPEQVLRRLGKQGDLFEPVLTLRQHLPGVHPPEIGTPAVWQSGRSAKCRKPVGGEAQPKRRPKGSAAPDRSPKGLAAYRRKRDFSRTPEPPGTAAGGGSGALFVIHKHAARSLHYDFRLAVGGVLKSWAVPKGPSLDPAEKRLAVRTEDHPLEYADFEGCIPKGQYGTGEVIIWDRGTFLPGDGQDASTVEQALEKGHLDFWLEGVKLRGGFLLVRSRKKEADREQWLLMKKDDDAADPGADPVRCEPQSVVSGLWLDDLRSGGSR